MKMCSLVSRALASVCLLLMLVSAGPGSAQAPSPTVVPSLTSLAEARVIIDTATAFARDQKMVMAVVVVDQAGNVVSGDRMDGSSFGNTHLAEGKAFASLVFRQTTEVLAGLAKDRPDRYFGIMNMYPGKVYLVGGGVPLVVDGQIVGAVAVAGLPQGVDEKAGRAGIDAWDKLRQNLKK
jgi:uncharacterized protein GlcG (DUF336 family)